MAKRALRISEYIYTTLIERWGESFLEFNNELGKGSLQIISFDWGISTMFWDVHLNEDISLVLIFGDFAPIDFLYILNGHMKYNSRNKKSIQLDSSQNIIIGYENNTEYGFILPGDVSFQMHVIQIIPSLYNNKMNSNVNLVYTDLRHLFLNQNRPSFLYFGEKNLLIAEKIKEKKIFPFEGATRTMLLEGLTYYILALQIESLKANKEKPGLPKGFDSRYLELLEKCFRHIDVNLSTVNIESLSKTYPISVDKIQTGFKFCYGITVNAYIREKRLSKSLELISQNKFSISEIGYSIGYDSRSYFSKIFRERFGISPSKYKKGLHRPTTSFMK